MRIDKTRTGELGWGPVMESLGAMACNLSEGAMKSQ